jgi:ligand-binding sensor domain-containing protein
MAAAGLPNISVTALAVDDSTRTLWAATSAGVFRVSGGRAAKVDGLVDATALSLLRARNGDMLIGTRGGGLVRYHDGVFTRLTTADGLTHNSITALYEDAGGTLWIGTNGGGLDLLSHGRIGAVREKNGLPDDTVYSIIEDGLGSLWMSSTRGVWRCRGAPSSNAPRAAATSARPRSRSPTACDRRRARATARRTRSRRCGRASWCLRPPTASGSWIRRRSTAARRCPRSASSACA